MFAIYLAGSSFIAAIEITSEAGKGRVAPGDIDNLVAMHLLRG